MHQSNSTRCKRPSFVVVSRFREQEEVVEERGSGGRGERECRDEVEFFFLSSSLSLSTPIRISFFLCLLLLFEGNSSVPPLSLEPCLSLWRARLSEKRDRKTAAAEAGSLQKLQEKKLEHVKSVVVVVDVPPFWSAENLESKLSEGSSFLFHRRVFCRRPRLCYLSPWARTGNRRRGSRGETNRMGKEER